MLTKDDLMKLSKERLCELLLEEWSKKENTLVPFDFPSLGRDDCYHGGQCTNPYHDCINCPRIFLAMVQPFQQMEQIYNL